MMLHGWDAANALQQSLPITEVPFCPSSLGPTSMTDILNHSNLALVFYGRKDDGQNMAHDRLCENIKNTSHESTARDAFVHASLEHSLSVSCKNCL